MRRHAAWLLALLAVTAAALVGCGLGPGESRGGDGASLRVTRDFGRQLLTKHSEPKVRSGQSVMRLLRSAAKVKTRYGGGFVQSIDGLAGGGPSGRRDWFYFVNGILADKGADERTLSPGDVVQWDYRDWRGAMDVKAIVGSYPEPFAHGQDGRRLPTRVECEAAEQSACEQVKDTLGDAGAPATGSALGASGTKNVIRVVVARWGRARQLPSVRALEGDARSSGVFARFTGGGRRLELLDADGGSVRRAAPGSGLVAALRPSDEELVWVVTGLDDVGVSRAARALNGRDLRDAFAVVTEPSGVRSLPLEDPR